MFFPNSNEVRDREVNVKVGDKVKVIVWDLGYIEGMVSELKSDSMIIVNANFSGGCYEQCDYTELEQQSTFEVKADDVYECSVATYESITPLTLVSKALNLNYCGSEYIIMSPAFYKDYMKYTKDGYYAKKYCQYDIKVDQELKGQYVVKAVPNEKSLKHMETPLENYWIDFYQKGKWIGSHLFSAFPDDFLSNIEIEKQKFVRKTGKTSYAYKVRDTDNLSVFARGSATNHFSVNRAPAKRVRKSA